MPLIHMGDEMMIMRADDTTTRIASPLWGGTKGGGSSTIAEARS
ncbi:MAG: hypothetical protein ACI9GK_000063 [Devosia sp.]|jgi:hypothetical protein